MTVVGKKLWLCVVTGCALFGAALFAVLFRRNGRAAFNIPREWFFVLVSVPLLLAGVDSIPVLSINGKTVSELKQAGIWQRILPKKEVRIRITGEPELYRMQTKFPWLFFFTADPDDEHSVIQNLQIMYDRLSDGSTTIDGFLLPLTERQRNSLPLIGCSLGSEACLVPLPERRYAAVYLKPLSGIDVSFVSKPNRSSAVSFLEAGRGVYSGHIGNSCCFPPANPSVYWAPDRCRVPKGLPLSDTHDVTGWLGKDIRDGAIFQSRLAGSDYTLHIRREASFDFSRSEGSPGMTITLREYSAPNVSGFRVFAYHTGIEGEKREGWRIFRVHLDNPPLAQAPEDVAVPAVPGTFLPDVLTDDGYLQEGVEVSGSRLGKKGRDAIDSVIVTFERVPGLHVVSVDFCRVPPVLRRCGDFSFNPLLWYRRSRQDDFFMFW